MIIAGLEDKEQSKELQTRKADRNKADEKEIWKQNWLELEDHKEANKIEIYQ